MRDLLRALDQGYHTSWCAVADMSWQWWQLLLHYASDSMKYHSPHGEAVSYFGWGLQEEKEEVEGAPRDDDVKIGETEERGHSRSRSRNNRVIKPRRRANRGWHHLGYVSASAVSNESTSVSGLSTTAWKGNPNRRPLHLWGPVPHNLAASQGK